MNYVINTNALIEMSLPVKKIPRFARNRLRNLIESEIAMPFGIAMIE